MQKLYLKVLKRLSNKGIGQETEVSDLFKCYFKNAPKKEIEHTDEGDVEPTDLEHFIEKTSHPRVDKICEFLKTMQKNGWLTYTNHSVESNNYNWSKRPIHITATITKEGDEYYRENKSKWWELWSFWATLVGVILTAFGIWLSHKESTKGQHEKPDEQKSQPSTKFQRSNHSSQPSKQQSPKTLPSDSSRK